VTSVTRRTEYWYGGVWQGAAHLDGRRGSELVVGHTSGAHTLFFHALTWRDGRLVTLDAPGRGVTWVVDGAANVAIGWQRRAGDPAGLIRHGFAARKSNGDMRLTVSTFRWRQGGWSRVERRVVDPATDRAAYAWAGWRVPGLQRY
jgi:hypothetical protein